MDEQLISFETAKLAKEKGCDLENCTCGGYPDCICSDKRISQSLLAKWLREKHEIYVTPRESYAFDQTLEFVCSVNNIFVNHGNNDEPVNRFKTYEESYEIGLQEALKLIKSYEKI